MCIRYAWEYWLAKHTLLTRLLLDPEPPTGANVAITFDMTEVFFRFWTCNANISHDDVIKWKHFPRYWPFVRGIHRSPVNYPTKANDAELWYFILIYALTNVWINTRDAGDLRRHRTHYDVTVMNIYWQYPHTVHIFQLRHLTYPST